MRVLCLASVFLLALGTSAVGQAPERPSEPGAEEAERAYYAALASGDAKALRSILAEDLTDIGEDGIVGGKKRIIDALPNFKGTIFKPFNMVSRRLGNGAAVVIGTVSVSSTSNPSADVSYYIFSDTFVKGKDGWQLVASQQKEIPVWMARRMEDSELKALPSSDCSKEGSIKSLDNATGSYVRFKNTTSRPVTLYWINYEGKRDSNPGQTEVIKPGSEAERNTWTTHPFLLTDQSGKCLGVYMPDKRAGLVVVK